LSRLAPLAIDATTLADLEVFRSVDGGPGVFAMIDRTATTRGRAALRRRFAAPSADVRSLRDTQDAVRFFARHPRLLRLDDLSIRRVEEYLDCSIWVRSRTRIGLGLEEGWMWLRYRDLPRELRAGIGATVQLFRRVRRVCDEMMTRDPPRLVRDTVLRLRDTAEAVVGARRSGALLLTTDRRLRLALQKDITDSLDDLAELDSLNAMAAAGEKWGWVMPELIEAEGVIVEADGLVHPFVESAVANPVRLDREGPVVFLTGPNMAGKTTWMRAIGLAVILAQVGMGVPARRMRWAPADALCTSLMNPTDDVREGLSTFMSEVERVRTAADLLAPDRRALVLFDEVFKGTNVHDARDASALVIRGFARTRRGVAVFSSHLAELGEDLAGEGRIRFRRFAGRLEGREPHFDYEIRDGVSDQRFGMLLLQRAGVPELMRRIEGRS
jgi:DNA mismatch repair ATPase MutS